MHMRKVALSLKPVGLLTVNETVITRYIGVFHRLTLIIV